MLIWGTIPLLLVVAFFVVLTWLQRKYHGFWKTGHQTNTFFMQEDALALTVPREVLPADDLSWKDINSIYHLRLALHLAEKALPVWARYARKRVAYHAVSVGPVTIVETDLLQKTLQEINYHVHRNFVGADLTKIREYHNLFVGPVLALKDGIWVCAHPVKKVFMSVYHISRSIVEQNIGAAPEHFLPEAITLALESLELSGLYTRKEIAGMLSTFRSGLKGDMNDLNEIF